MKARQIFRSTMCLITLGAPLTAFAGSVADLDGDGVSEAIDNCLEVQNPDQNDTNADGYGDACDADYSDDGVVGGPDFARFLAAFGSSRGDGEYDPIYDHNGDGGIGGPDLGVLLVQFGGSPGPSGLDCAGTVPCISPETGPLVEEGWIPTPDGPQWATYELEPEFAVFQGDIVFPLDELRAFQSTIDDPHPVRPASYAMPNGDGELDDDYEGEGDPWVALEMLSGGKGELADGFVPTYGNWQAHTGWVSWSTTRGQHCDHTRRQPGADDRSLPADLHRRRAGRRARPGHGHARGHDLQSGSEWDDPPRGGDVHDRGSLSGSEGCDQGEGVGHGHLL
jgi:hypothetical protein